MLVPQPHLSPLLCEQHFRTYSPGLVDYPDRFVPLLSPKLSFVSIQMVYVCPLCVGQYLIYLPDGICGSTEFSEDHLPPESVGGRFKVLTCKKCNNDAGHYEAELLRLLDFGTVPDKRHQSIFTHARVASESTGESYPVAVRRTGDIVNFEFREPAKQHNKKLKAFIEKIHTSQFPKLTVMVGVPDEQKLAKAILKSSYLLGFVFWGYEFVYSRNGQWIREALQGDREYPTRVPMRWEEASDSHLQRGVSILQRNGNKEAFLMTLELTTSTERIMTATLFPSPLENGWEKLAELKPIVEGNIPTQMQITTIPRTLRRRGYTTAWAFNLRHG
jgi:hypothetical protein